MLLVGLAVRLLRHPADPDARGRVVVGRARPGARRARRWCTWPGAGPQPGDGAQALRGGGGALGWLAADPLTTSSPPGSPSRRWSCWPPSGCWWSPPRRSTPCRTASTRCAVGCSTGPPTRRRATDADGADETDDLPPDLVEDVRRPSPCRRCVDAPRAAARARPPTDGDARPPPPRASTGRRVHRAGPGQGRAGRRPCRSAAVAERPPGPRPSPSRSATGPAARPARCSRSAGSSCR